MLDYADERCNLNRRFGSEQEATTLQISSYGSYSDFRILLFGGALPVSSQPVTETRYRLSADQVEREKVDTLNRRLDGASTITFDGSFRPYKPERDSKKMPVEQRLTLGAEPEAPNLEFERQITVMTVELDEGERFDFQLGSMAKPLEAFRQCIDDLIEGWGLDPAQERTLTRYPIPDMRSVKRLQSNYPPRMIRAGTNAFVPVRIMVNEQGRSTECIVQNSSVEADFQAAVCRGLATQYSPALDAAGRPVASVFTTSVLFILR